MILSIRSLFSASTTETAKASPNYWQKAKNMEKEAKLLRLLHST
jgi:hypothetical protein